MAVCALKRAVGAGERKVGHAVMIEALDFPVVLAMTAFTICPIMALMRPFVIILVAGDAGSIWLLNVLILAVTGRTTCRHMPAAQRKFRLAMIETNALPTACIMAIAT